MCLGNNTAVSNKKRLRRLSKVLPARVRQIKWSELSYLVKIPVALVPPTALWIALSALNKQPLRVLLPSLLAAYGKTVGLLGLKDIFDELKKNLGVKLTIPRTYQVFSAVGYLLSTISELALRSTGVGRVFLSFNVIFLLCYSYMLYLTSVYNSRLEESSRTFESSFASSIQHQRHKVNIPALTGLITINLLTIYTWINEGINSLSSPFKNEILAAVGFLLISLGNMRSGFKAATTSTADITPFAGAFTVGLATALSGVSLIPLSKTSPIARIYLAGYASVVYSVFLNAFYAWKQERRRRMSPWQTPRARL